MARIASYAVLVELAMAHVRSGVPTAAAAAAKLACLHLRNNVPNNRHT